MVRRDPIGWAVILVSFVCWGTTGAAAELTSNWVLHRARGIASPQPKPVLTIDGQKLSGSTGCNTFTATLTERSGNRVAVDQVLTSRGLCGPRESDLENTLFRAFAQTQFLERKDKTLRFLSDRREVLLHWTRATVQTKSAQPTPRKVSSRAVRHPTTRGRSARRDFIAASRRAVRRPWWWCTFAG